MFPFIARSMILCIITHMSSDLRFKRLITNVENTYLQHIECGMECEEKKLGFLCDSASTGASLFSAGIVKVSKRYLYIITSLVITVQIMASHLLDNV